LGSWEPSQHLLIDKGETKKNLCRDGRSQDLPCEFYVLLNLISYCIVCIESICWTPRFLFSIRRLVVCPCQPTQLRVYPTICSVQVKLPADPSGRTVYGVGLRPLTCRECGFESRRGHGCLSLVSVLYCQVQACGVQHNSTLTLQLAVFRDTSIDTGCMPHKRYLYFLIHPLYIL